MSVTYLAIVPQECGTSYKFLSNAQIHTLPLTNDTFGCALTICSFSPSEIRVFGRRAGTTRKKRSHACHAEIKMSRNPLQTCPFDGTRDTPGAETRPAGKPVGGFRRQNDMGNMFGRKFQRERKTPPRPPRKRFCTGIFPYEPRNKNSEPRKKNSGAWNFAFRPRNFASDRPKSKRYGQKLAQKPRFVQKNRAKICYLERIAQKSRHENQPKRNNLSVFTSIS